MQRSGVRSPCRPPIRFAREAASVPVFVATRHVTRVRSSNERDDGEVRIERNGSLGFRDEMLVDSIYSRCCRRPGDDEVRSGRAGGAPFVTCV